MKDLNTNVRHNLPSVMPLDSLELIQDGLRSLETLKSMISHVSRGGVFSPDLVYDTIAITEFPDGRRIIHDGLHRCLSIYLCHKHYLLPNEYHIKYWDYDHYNQISFENGYVTPFDPRTEVRLADFGVFKENVKQFYELSGHYEATEYILDNPHLYRAVKTMYNLKDLAESVKPLLDKGLRHTQHKRKILAAERLS